MWQTQLTIGLGAKFAHDNAKLPVWKSNNGTFDNNAIMDGNLNIDRFTVQAFFVVINIAAGIIHGRL